MKITHLLALLLVPSLAWAQDDMGGDEGGAGAGAEASGGEGEGDGDDGMGDDEAGNYGAGTWEPEGADDADGAGGETGVSGGDFVSTTANEGLAGDEERGRPAVIPEYHEVKEGETLWDLCKLYYNDPWTWPQLWAENKGVTNPHWIYPGDKIKMLGYQDAKPESPTAKSPEVIRRSGGVFRSDGVRIYQHAFLDPEEMEKAGHITGSKIARLMVSEGDEVYIEEIDGHKPKVGETYSAFKVDRELKADGKWLGNIVEVLGKIRIKKINEQGTATGEILESINPIERGTLVGPLRRVYQKVPAVPADRDLEAQIVEAFRLGQLTGTDDIVFINKGNDDGVRIGNRFLVTQRGDAYRRVYQDRIVDNPKYPYETMAEVLVVDVKKISSVGVVTRATIEVRKKDRVQLRRGY